MENCFPTKTSSSSNQLLCAAPGSESLQEIKMMIHYQTTAIFRQIPLSVPLHPSAINNQMIMKWWKHTEVRLMMDVLPLYGQQGTLPRASNIERFHQHSCSRLGTLSSHSYKVKVFPAWECCCDKRRPPIIG